MNTTRAALRKEFKAIGYRVSFPRNPLNDSIVNIAFQSDNMLKPANTSSANVYSAEFFKEHRAAFDLANAHRNDYLTDTEQKIV